MVLSSIKELKFSNFAGHDNGPIITMQYTTYIMVLLKIIHCTISILIWFAGGIYYIISRSLGPEFGASVGIVFAFANSVAASMNTIGFCDSLNDLLASYDTYIIDGGINDVRLVGVIAIFVMILICAIGMEWESKAQNFLVAIIVGAMFDFLIGTAIGPLNDEQRAKGFTGFSCEYFLNNTIITKQQIELLNVLNCVNSYYLYNFKGVPFN